MLVVQKNVENFETQIKQFTQELWELREKCKSITTRSGVVVGKGIDDNLQSKESDIESEERKIDREEKKEEEGKNKSEEGEVKEKNERVQEEKRKKEIENEKRSVPIVDLPYPHAPFRKNIEGQFIRFCEILKQLEISICLLYTSDAADE